LFDQAEKLRYLVKKKSGLYLSDKSFIFCSLCGGSGCSLIALSLSFELSKDLKVIVIENNYLSPSFANYLNLVNNYNFNNIIRNEEIEKQIMKISDNFDIIYTNLLDNYNEDYFEVKNFIFKIDNFLKDKYNILFYDFGNEFLFYNYFNFLEKIFLIIKSDDNSFSNLYRFLKKIQREEKKIYLIINLIYNERKVNEKIKFITNETKNIEKIYFIKYNEKIVKYLNEQKDIRKIFELLNKENKMLIEDIRKLIVNS